VSAHSSLPTSSDCRHDKYDDEDDCDYYYYYYYFDYDDGSVITGALCIDDAVNCDLVNAQPLCHG
jgi:hypothetical protein